MSTHQWQKLMNPSRRIAIIGLCLLTALLALINVMALKPYWQITPPPHSATPPPLPNLAQYNLMGAALTQQLPQLMLHLTLQGTIVGKPSLALIYDGKKTQLYHAGDTLPGGATIKDILADHIVVDYQQSLHSLKLPRESLLSTPSS